MSLGRQEHETKNRESQKGFQVAHGQMHLREVNKKEGEEWPKRSLGGESGLEGWKGHRHCD